MAAGKLVFTKPADGSGRLVFGEEGAAVVPDAVFSIDGDLPDLGPITLRAGACMSIDAELPGLDGSVALKWDANVSRSMQVRLQSTWGQAEPIAAALQAPWQEAKQVRSLTIGRWREATRARSVLAALWQDTERLRSLMGSHWQEAIKRRGQLGTVWQEAERRRAGLAVHWQEAIKRRSMLASHWQETLRLRGGVGAHWQYATPLRHAVRGHWQPGMPVQVFLRPHWQEAIRPPSGVSYQPPVPPEPKPPCYDPATIGRLVFTEFAMGDGKLVFVCQRPGQVLPPARVIVPPQRTYIVINSVEIRRADDLNGDPLPSESFSMSLDHQSWSWKFSASFHISARAAVTPGPGNPVELEVRVNDQPFRLLAEVANPSRRFGEHVIAVTGRGRAAHLDDQAAVQTFGNTLDLSAHQLMLECLTINGAGFGWTVDWGLQNWIVPAGVWMHRGTWISALADIAGAAGGYLQPHDTDEVMRVLPLWPQPWWRFDQLTPDIELPEGYSEIDDTNIIYQPDYNRIFVAGETGGIVGDHPRAGTDGTVLKPMVTHPLMTSIDVTRQRAIAELSASGTKLLHKMTLPVAPATGVIKPGTILRYVDDGSAWRTGIVRSTGISQQFPVLTQSLEVESHA